MELNVLTSTKMEDWEAEIALDPFPAFQINNFYEEAPGYWDFVNNFDREYGEDEEQEEDEGYVSS